MAVLILSQKNLSWDNCFRKSIDNKTIEAGNRRERLIVISAKFLCAHIVLLWIIIPIALNPNYCFFREGGSREKHANKQIEKGKTLMQLFWKGLNARWCVEVSYKQKFIQFVLNAKFQTYKWCASIALSQMRIVLAQFHLLNFLWACYSLSSFHPGKNKIPSASSCSK